MPSYIPGAWYPVIGPPSPCGANTETGGEFIGTYTTMALLSGTEHVDCAIAGWLAALTPIMKRPITTPQSNRGQLVLLVEVVTIIPRQFIVAAPSSRDNLDALNWHAHHVSFRN